MKLLLLVLGLLLLALLVSPAGHGAHHPHHLAPGHLPADSRRPRPPRVVRSPTVARQHRLVRSVPRKE